MRMKVLEALAAGKALVATPRAAEGVEALPGEHLLVADDEDEIVDALASSSCSTRARRRRLAESARRWAESQPRLGRGSRRLRGALRHAGRHPRTVKLVAHRLVLECFARCGPLYDELPG